MTRAARRIADGKRVSVQNPEKENPPERSKYHRGGSVNLKRKTLIFPRRWGGGGKKIHLPRK